MTLSPCGNDFSACAVKAFFRKRDNFGL